MFHDFVRFYSDSWLCFDDIVLNGHVHCANVIMDVLIGSAVIAMV